MMHRQKAGQHHQYELNTHHRDKALTKYRHTTVGRYRHHTTFALQAAGPFQQADFAVRQIATMFELQECDTITAWPVKAKRSEEHTSELQSRFDIVCRLL